MVIGRGRARAIGRDTSKVYSGRLRAMWEVLHLQASESIMASSLEMTKCQQSLAHCSLMLYRATSAVMMLHNDSALSLKFLTLAFQIL